SCFAAGTPIETRDGTKPIEQIRPLADFVLSRDENNPDGPLAYKMVEEIFVRVAPVLNLHVGGQLIRTTAVHPFYAWGKGWSAVAFLEAGDWLLTKTGQWVQVDAVTDSGEVATVYNLRVETFHTYFVGGEDWGFSVWAHNACHVADWELRGSNGQISTRGTMQSGAAVAPGRRLNWTEQLATHTEVKNLDSLQGRVKAGDIVTIRGTKLPCNPGGQGCQSTMQDFANANGVRVIHTDTTTGTRWTFGN